MFSLVVCGTLINHVVQYNGLHVGFEMVDTISAEYILFPLREDGAECVL